MRLFRDEVRGGFFMVGRGRGDARGPSERPLGQRHAERQLRLGRRPAAPGPPGRARPPTRRRARARCAWSGRRWRQRRRGSATRSEPSTRTCPPSRRWRSSATPGGGDAALVAEITTNRFLPTTFSPCPPQMTRPRAPPSRSSGPRAARRARHGLRVRALRVPAPRHGCGRPRGAGRRNGHRRVGSPERDRPPGAPVPRGPRPRPAHDPLDGADLPGPPRAPGPSVPSGLRDGPPRVPIAGERAPRLRHARSGDGALRAGRAARPARRLVHACPGRLLGDVLRAGRGEPVRGVHAGGVVDATLGFAMPPDDAGVVLSFTAAGLGLVLLALFITYLPSLYGPSSDASAAWPSSRFAGSRRAAST